MVRIPVYVFKSLCQHLQGLIQLQNTFDAHLCFEKVEVWFELAADTLHYHYTHRLNQICMERHLEHLMSLIFCLVSKLENIKHARESIFEMTVKEHSNVTYVLLTHHFKSRIHTAEFLPNFTFGLYFLLKSFFVTIRNFCKHCNCVN